MMYHLAQNQGIVIVLRNFGGKSDGIKRTRMHFSQGSLAGNVKENVLGHRARYAKSHQQYFTV